MLRSGILRTLPRRAFCPPSLHFRSTISKVFSTAVPHSTFSELFVEGKNCDGILALVSERYLNPDAVKDEAVSVAKNTSTVPDLGDCNWLLLVDAHQRAAPPGTPGPDTASTETQILAEALQIMSPKLNFGAPKGAESVQMAIVRQVVFDPKGGNLWPTMRAVADGAKEVCDQIMAVEKVNLKGDEWCRNLIEKLEK